MTQIIVVGAGITGLTTALSLHKAGFTVRVFESVVELMPLGVGINLLPHSVQILGDLGLLPTLEQNSVLTGALRYHAKDGKMIWAEPRGRDAGYPVPQCSIHRGTLQMLLLDAVRDRLGENSVATGRTFIGFEESDNAIKAIFRNTAHPDRIETVDADCLIGADGIMSTVRAGFYPAEGNPVYSGQVLWRGVSMAPPFADGRTMVMIGNDARKAVIYPIRNLDDGRQVINWIAELAIEQELPSNKGDWNRAGNPDDFMPAFADWRFDWLDVPELFRGATSCWEFPMVDRDPVPRWSFGRVTLAGDAAHAMRPNGSNGASQGILDAEAIAQCMAATADTVAALREYERRRLEPTRMLTLANRETGPEIVLRMVEERCPDGFDDIHDHFTPDELQAIGDSYKQLAGFARPAGRDGRKSA